MNKRQARLFAVGSTALAALAFAVMTVDSHRQFPTLTNADAITPEVRAGQDVWHRYNCVNCHTLFGEGAYYAPDLTKIAQHRGDAYLKAYMRDPAAFYDERRHRRLMPKQNLSETEIADLVSFLGWIAKVDNQGWPPRPILVTGASIPGTDLSTAQQTQGSGDGAAGTLPPGARPVSGAEDPIALGQAIFRSVQPSCTACHSVAPGVNMAGPSLAGVATRAERIVGTPDYRGRAKDVAGYLREAITEPSAHLVPGPMYSSGGTSFMPDTYRSSLDAARLEQLVAYLSTLR